MSKIRTDYQRGEYWVTMIDETGRNALGEVFVGELTEAIAALPEDARVLILCGLSDVFCSGASREVLDEVTRGVLVPSDTAVARALLDVPVPTIAVMEGHAIGGGLALGLCADMVLMARESRYGCSFMNMGFTPGMGVTRLLEHLVPRAIAHEMMYGGEPMRGTHLQQAGVNYVLPRNELRDKASELAARIAEKSRVSLAALKRHLGLPKRTAFEEARAAEALLHQICFDQDDIAERIESGYAE